MALLILAITSIFCSRAMFAFLNDPEGPNLLVVMVMALIVYLLSLAIYFFSPAKSFANRKRLAVGIGAQIAIVTVLYFVLI